MAYKKFKIHKDKKPQRTPRQRTVVNEETNSQVDMQPQQPQITPADQEVLNKIEELHVFLTQRGLAYLVLAQTPSKQIPAGKFSFNHEHNKPEQTFRNAEWAFRHLGDMLSRGTGGSVELIRHY